MKITLKCRVVVFAGEANDQRKLVNVFRISYSLILPMGIIIKAFLQYKVFSYKYSSFYQRSDGYRRNVVTHTTRR